ncbi:MAG: serine/threonine-protein kinase, partial [Myxococcota bacterium]
AKVAARMSHPGVVQVFDFGEHEGELFLAMELVEGTHVGRVIRSANRQEQSIPLEVALHITARTAHALAYAHRQGGDDAGFVHRDVSPANILLTATGHVKLTDFGIAKMSHQSRHTEDGHVRGKLGYMSPEQVLGRALDGRSDVFTLATVFAEMLIGQPLFGEGSELDILVRIRDVDLTPLERSPARIPKDVLTLLKTGLARMPEDRPSAAAFAEACEEVRRRRAMAHGPERTARLLKRLHLTDVAGNDNGTTGETTALVDTSNLAPEAADLIRGIDTSKNVYRVRLASGDEVGPVSYPRLVQMITSGQVTSDTVIAKADGHFVPASEMPELTRFVTSPAISWSPGEPANASRRGDITTGRMIPLVHQILRTRETGVLHLWQGERRKKIYFVEGRPEFVASTDRHELLGEHLVAGGYCLRMEVEMGLALMPRYGGRLGDALIGLEVLRPVELFRAISDQVRHRLLEAFRWREGRWAFVAGARSHEETFLIGESGYPLLRDAVVAMRIEELEANLSEIWEHALERTPILEERAHSFGLSDGWLRLLQRANRTTVGGLLAEIGREQPALLDSAYRALFLGVRCGLVGVVVPSAPLAPSETL